MLQPLYGIHLASDSDEANQALAAFIDTWDDTPLVEFDRLVETLLEWGDENFRPPGTGTRSPPAKLTGRLSGILSTPCLPQIPEIEQLSFSADESVDVLFLLETGELLAESKDIADSLRIDLPVGDVAYVRANL